MGGGGFFRDNVLALFQLVLSYLLHLVNVCLLRTICPVLYWMSLLTFKRVSKKCYCNLKNGEAQPTARRLGPGVRGPRPEPELPQTLSHVGPHSAVLSLCIDWNVEEKDEMVQLGKHKLGVHSA